MTKHLSDEQLLNEQFKLNNPSGSQRIQEHLYECSECARRAQELAERFAALDELEDPLEVSEQSIADILRTIRKRKPAARPYPLLARVLWVATPAAMLVFAALVLMPSPSRVPTETRNMVAESVAERVLAPRVVSLARSLGGAGEAVPARPLLGRTAVMVIAKATPTFKRRQWVADAVAGKDLESMDEAKELDLDAQPMLAMSEPSVQRMVAAKEAPSPRRKSVLAVGMAVDAMEMEDAAAESWGKTEAPVQLASYSAPAAAPETVQLQEAHRHDQRCRCEGKKDLSTGTDIPMDRIFRSEKETEEWKSMIDQTPLRIQSKPVGSVDSNRAVTAWEVSVQNLSDSTVDVGVVRPLLYPGWTARVLDGDVSIQPDDESNLRFTLTVGPRATETFAYELHPALPASGGVVENAKE